MSGFAQLIILLFMLCGLLFIWSVAGFIYAIMKYANNPPPAPPSDTEERCSACANLCAFAASLSYKEQIMMFPNLILAYIACKIVNCSCE